MSRVKISFLKRAFFYMTRKKGKSLIIFCILFILSTLVITGLSILTAAEQAALSLRQSVGGSIRLELDKNNSDNWTYQQAVGGTLVDYTGEPITDDEIQKVMSVKGIKAYNGIGDGSVHAVDFSFLSGFQFGPGSDYSRLPSVTNSEYFNYFTRGAFRLADGRHINQDDDHAVLISTEAAEKNGLKIGDTITVQSNYDSGVYPEVQLTIVGIYEYMAEPPQFTTTSTDKRNRLIVDHKAMQEIMQTEEIEYANGVDFYVEDPKDLESIAEEIRALPLNWDCFYLSVDNTAYEAVAASLTAMRGIVSGLTLGIIFAGIVTLSLILSLWIRQRTKETGILLSVGVEKYKIALQYIAEILLAAVFAFGFSYLSGSAAAQGTSDLIFNRVAQTQPTPEVETPDDGSEYLDITGEYIPYQTGNQTAADSIAVEVSLRTLLSVCIVGILIITASVLIASVRLFRMKPRHILSLMS